MYRRQTRGASRGRSLTPVNEEESPRQSASRSSTPLPDPSTSSNKKVISKREITKKNEGNKISWTSQEYLKVFFGVACGVLFTYVFIKQKEQFQKFSIFQNLSMDFKSSLEDKINAMEQLLGNQKGDLNSFKAEELPEIIRQIEKNCKNYCENAVNSRFEKENLEDLVMDQELLNETINIMKIEIEAELIQHNKINEDLMQYNKELERQLEEIKSQLQNKKVIENLQLQLNGFIEEEKEGKVQKSKEIEFLQLRTKEYEELTSDSIKQLKDKIEFRNEELDRYITRIQKIESKNQETNALLSKNTKRIISFKEVLEKNTRDVQERLEQTIAAKLTQFQKNVKDDQVLLVSRNNEHTEELKKEIKKLYSEQQRAHHAQIDSKQQLNYKLEDETKKLKDSFKTDINRLEQTSQRQQSDFHKVSTRVENLENKIENYNTNNKKAHQPDELYKQDNQHGQDHIDQRREDHPTQEHSHTHSHTHNHQQYEKHRHDDQPREDDKHQQEERQTQDSYGQYKQHQIQDDQQGQDNNNQGEVEQQTQVPYEQYDQQTQNYQQEQDYNNNHQRQDSYEQYKYQTHDNQQGQDYNNQREGEHQKQVPYGHGSQQREDENQKQDDHHEQQNYPKSQSHQNTHRNSNPRKLRYRDSMNKRSS